MANEDFDKVLGKVLIELASPEESKKAAASAVVAVLLSQAPEGRTLSPNVVPAVLPLLSSGNVLIQVIVEHTTRHLRTLRRQIWRHPFISLPVCTLSAAEELLRGINSCRGVGDGIT